MAKKALEISRWDDVKVFLAIAERGSLSEAARALRTEQSTIGRRLSALESDLGVILVERSLRGCLLTPAGERVLGEAKELETSFHRFLDAAKSEETAVRGRVRIAMTEGMAIHFVIPFVLPDLRARYPELSVDLVTGIAPANLARHEADLALRFFRDTDGDLTIKKLGQLERSVLVTKDRRKEFRGIQPDKLPWIGHTLDALDGLWIRSIGVTNLTIATASYEAQLAAIRAGLGVGLAPTILSRVYSDLTSLGPPIPKAPPMDVFLATRTTVRKIPRIVAVRTVLEKHFESLL